MLHNSLNSARISERLSSFEHETFFQTIKQPSSYARVLVSCYLCLCSSGFHSERLSVLKSDKGLNISNQSILTERKVKDTRSMRILNKLRVEDGEVCVMFGLLL